VAGKQALVCGATGGLGPAVVAAFIERGDSVIGVARSAAELARLEAKHAGRFRSEKADLSLAEQVDALWNRLDSEGVTPSWVVNVAGGFRGGKLVDSKPEDFPFMIEVNLATAWWSCRAAAPRLQRTGGGVIVNLASRSAVVNERGAAAYAVSKAGVLKLTQVLAEELKGTGVRVNAVLPTLIDTPANRKAMPAELMKKAVAPEAVAQVIMLLCSDEARIVSGAILPV
jgi:NAD(P)-dependent dehydrogenase (short-subunit alcohol dehydrogenase family)